MSKANVYFVFWANAPDWNVLHAFKAQADIRRDALHFFPPYHSTPAALPAMLAKLDGMPGFTVAQQPSFKDSQIRVYRHEIIKHFSFDFLVFMWHKHMHDLMTEAVKNRSK